ncbi:pyridoxamine 5'-phosphate oxidase family protein [Mesorhizobium sp. B2-3-4]|uniref:pyridoxamine 5'-phosphate oxidase family protein n=1 Tax=Mesorhizobium sp. B2-3-4 TaxID=2589959 RepID=UPI0011291E85|nr:pyridoxamine 5'-phosphate oxidase family protein [Mesorhizobium sp. B2-3-4]TPM38497.1 pyridoxamine 5-phosphate oxidase [Mesorhizobium sp. B2-3-4]
MNKPIDTAALLKSSVGRVPPPINVHVIGHLDRVALRWIAASPLMFAAFGDASGLGVTPGGGEAGFAEADAYELRLPVDRLDDPELAVPGQGFGALFLLPCIDEAMRVNGTVRAVSDGVIRIAVEECYGHSGKVLIRSEFWTSLLAALAPRGVRGFAAASHFMALATVDEEGRVELSPRDDPAGILARIDIGLSHVSDHATDRFPRLVRPQAAAILMVLGAGQIARVSGNARITADWATEPQFVFHDQTSALAAVIEDAVVTTLESPTLLRLERPGAPVTQAALSFARYIDRDRGVGAELASAALSVPGASDFLRKGLERARRDCGMTVAGRAHAACNGVKP